ncbi:MAG: 30S ribosomal protein S5 [Candidatus Methanoperedens nitroreducens]|uniref:Small ribosomal subunit protein uS5 n=1 Tax=Candidatus Methanoperedens nitratireducens TaxID=1392998 RepID=A0A0P7ZE51_9EURY|nr:30S ribosomal protein S5 [Candidatus Methanoperedens sp. BLZ2]KAB2945679.1 MAG: 30S ribosomal protein S5 [Candidatus Methanoperedens sp.]KPQ42983.1 MAG: 30S ribosomal protein S5 [Candidatus Methanoperedens sp. BLZ1]MBZ0177307.1 30S ribosomal protein S5 [Candidatus Methanoperedens nitroreducens]CAG0979944.1 30S ribosomal protein S5 [Methanosarcinales archaeon]MCX9076815.1 30S ribosomal protein S5 [Candidatus Methanoperedens sp.]
MRDKGFEQQKEEWFPQTRLGKLVKEGQVTTMSEALASGLPIRESQIVDALLPEIRDEVLDINMVQRMTDSGRRVKFRATVIVGNGDGFIGIGEGKDVQVGIAIRKAIDTAKMNVIGIKRGCGSWECGCGQGHTVPFEVKGKTGSVEVRLLPAPRGLGIASGGTAKKVLEIAGIKDVWTNVSGETRTTLNFAKATFDALIKTTTMKV